MQNGFCESFNRRMRDELLNETLFFGLDRARAKIGVWANDYNHARILPSDMRRPWNMRPTSPQQAIGSATPTSSADHLLLHPRPRAYQTPQLNSLLDESSEAGHQQALTSLKMH